MKAIPKELLHRSLNDGTDRLRSQFRDASQRGRQDDGYGSDQIEDTAWKGIHWGTRGIELFLKKKKYGGKTVDSELPPDADFPDAEPPIDAPPPTDRRDGMQVKTKETSHQQPNTPRHASRQQSPTVHASSDAASHNKAKPLKIKTRESRIVSRRDQPKPPRPRVETETLPPERKFSSSPAVQALHPKGHRRSPDIKTKDSYIYQQDSPPLHIREGHAQTNNLMQKMRQSFFRRKTVSSSGKLSPTSTQDEKEFIHGQSRKEAAKYTGTRRLKTEKIEPQVSNRRNISPSVLCQNSTPIQGVSEGKTSVKIPGTKLKTPRRAAQRTVKTAKRPTKALQVTRASAKTSQRAVQAVHSTVKTTAITAKSIAKYTATALKTTVSAIQELAAVIAAGGWVAVTVVLLVCMAGFLAASPYGLFMDGGNSSDAISSSAIMAQLNQELDAKLSELQESGTYDRVEIQGQPPAWKNVLSVFAARSMDILGGDRMDLLREVFWDMTKITTEIKTVEHPDSGKSETVLFITIKPRTPDDMRVFYQLSEQQNSFLDELMSAENQAIWEKLFSNGSGEIVSVALSQIGNIGGQPYWSWYGFNSHVNWCACFVSWCANECGYIDAGIIPKFASCTQGSRWFKNHGQWQSKSYEPRPGDVIFFDWNNKGSSGPQDGLPDHVGIVERVENGVVYTIEGNSGDRCRQRSYSVGHYEIFGYGTPSYS